LRVPDTVANRTRRPSGSLSGLSQPARLNNRAICSTYGPIGIRTRFRAFLYRGYNLVRCRLAPSGRLARRPTPGTPGSVHSTRYTHVALESVRVLPWFSGFPAIPTCLAGRNRSRCTVVANLNVARCRLSAPTVRPASYYGIMSLN